MSRDELEAATWKALQANQDHHRLYGGTDTRAQRTQADKAFVDAILGAADAYKNGDVTETRAEAMIREQRRAVLDGRTLHYIPLDDDGFACHPQGNATATTSLTDVTCKKCLRTDAYRQDLAVSA